VEKNSSIFNSRVLPTGFILALAMILAFEVLVSIIPEYKLLSPPYEKAMLALKGELVDKPQSFDIIVLGDCTGWAAIKPLELEKELHVTAYNLSVNAAQTYLMSYVLLNRYLANCTHKPQLVLMQLSASTIFYQWGMSSDALNYYILPWFRIDDDFMKELSAPMQRVCYKNRFLQLVPSLKNQFFLSKGFWPARIWKARREEFDHYVMYYREQKGFYNEDLDPAKQRIKKITDIGENFKQFSLSSFNMTYIQKILKTLARNNIQTIVCLTPVRDDEMLIWSQYNLRARLDSKLHDVLNGYHNVVAFWDMQSIASDPKYFSDWFHLDSRGASIFTAELSRRIKNLERKTQDMKQ
jgi:hypothetical protein